MSIDRTCSNPDCKKVYSIENQVIDDGFCSFECWEKENCKEPQEEVFENFYI